METRSVPSIPLAPSPRSPARRWPLPCFFALAYALSWGFWIPMAMKGERVDFGSTASHVPGLFGPMLAALAVVLMQRGGPGIRDLVGRMGRWRVHPVWLLVSLGSPLLFFAIAVAASAASGRAAPPFQDLGEFGGLPRTGPVAMWLLLIVCAAGEEMGWRGLALPELQRRHSPLLATLLLALAWAGWHVPSFFVLEGYRELGAAGIPGFAIGLACGAVVLTWLYNRTGGSLLMVTLWHGTYNLVSATKAARGSTAAVVSTLVMIWAVVLVVLEIRATRRRTRSVLLGSAAARRQ